MKDLNTTPSLDHLLPADWIDEAPTALLESLLGTAKPIKMLPVQSVFRSAASKLNCFSVQTGINTGSPHWKQLHSTIKVVVSERAAAVIISQRRCREIRKTRNYSGATLISYIIHVKVPLHFSLALFQQ